MEVGIANPDKAQVRCGGLFSIIKTGARMAALLHARRSVALDLHVRPPFTSSPGGGTLPDRKLSPSRNHSRRWRQVGGPRRVSPTVLKSAEPRRSPLLLSIHGTTAEELRAASGRAGAAVGASRASRTPGCGTLCCSLRRMTALLHAGRNVADGLDRSPSFHRFPRRWNPT